MSTTSRKPLFERLRQGLEEGIAHAKGELTLNTVAVPDDPPEIDATTLIALRAQAAMSQAVFAKMLSVSRKTLQSWEQGVREPSDASRRLIQIFTEHPEAVCASVGLPAVSLKGVMIESTGRGRRKIVVQPQKRRRKKAAAAR